MERFAWFQKLVAFAGRSELSRLLFSFRREFAHALGFTALANLLMLTPTLYMLQIFDRVMLSRSEFTLYAMTLVLFFFLGVMSFSEWVRSRLLVRLGVRLDMRLNPRVFATAFEMHCPEDESARLFKDMTRLRQALTGAGLFAILDAPWIPIYILVLFLMHPALGILSIVFCLILAGIACVSGRVMEEPLETASDAGRKEFSHMGARLRHAALIECMGMLGNIRDRWMRRHLVTLAQGRRGVDAQARMQSITRFVRLLQQSLALGAGAVLVIYGEISPAAMVAANVLMTRAAYPLDALIKTWKDILAAKRAFLNLEAALEDRPEREAATVEAGTPGAALRLGHVTADAAGRARSILDDVSLEIPAGIALGVKGPSGSGKSTLARVLLGIWPDMEGDVLFDGAPIHSLDRVELGARIGYLPQDVELFGGTIAENVARFGEVDPALVIEACQQAGVHEMILRFPKGYDTQIGESGNFLSGGQRQRIGLARAIYGNPRLVVLDEPNSSLDEAGDRALLQAVMTLKERGVTLVLISHRPRIMAVMDVVLHMEEGRVLRLEAPAREEKPAGRAAGFSGAAHAGASGYGVMPGTAMTPIVMPMQ
ncbi:MAG: type I secretion system permease/ATPase [Azoarcus sp.]|jgi:ATP-binding cassette subfamily C exporter for protease/lipase|nr:type I secretion system permease/ATPase [Azoarcus sp.]